MGSNGKVAAERAPDRQGAETLFLREAASHPAQKSRHCLESDLREESRAWTEARPRPRPLPRPVPPPLLPHIPGQLVHLSRRRAGAQGGAGLAAGHRGRGRLSLALLPPVIPDSQEARGCAGPPPPPPPRPARAPAPDRVRPAVRTFTLGRVLTPVPEDVDLVDGSVRLKKFFQLLFRPGPGDLSDKHLNGIWVWLV